MRNIIIGVILASLAIISIGIILTTDGRSIRNQEVTGSLDTAVDSTVNMLEKQTYTIDDSDQFVADMLEALAVQIDSKCELTVNVLDRNYEKGLLSIEAIETFKHPNGKVGQVSSTKTVILEHKEQVSVPEEKYTVEYYVQDKDGANRLYKKYTLKKNEAITRPTDPEQEGKIFTGWLQEGVPFNFMDGEGEIYKIDQNIILTAKFE